MVAAIEKPVGEPHWQLEIGGCVLCDGFKDPPVGGSETPIAKTPWKTVSDEKGRSPPGEPAAVAARIEVEADGFATQSIDVDLPPDQEATRDVRLAGTSGVAGAVMDPVCTPPRPIAGATVAVPDARFTAKTDANGKYQLQGLPPGPVTLAVDPPAGYRSTQGEVELKAGENLSKDFPLAGGEGFAGTVVWTSADRSVPVAGATVKIRGTTLSAASDGEGRFIIAAPPHLAQVPLTVTAEGFVAVEVQRDREAAQKPIALTGAAIARGRVMTRRKRPLAARGRRESASRIPR